MGFDDHFCGEKPYLSAVRRDDLDLHQVSIRRHFVFTAQGREEMGFIWRTYINGDLNESLWK